MGEPTEMELDVLEVMAGRREGGWGAAVGACLEFLHEDGLCTDGPHYRITSRGLAVLDKLRPKDPANV